MDIVTTTNRRLEGYLYALGIAPIAYEVLWDGMVQWTYKNTEDFRHACTTFKETKQMMYRKKA